MKSSTAADGGAAYPHLRGTTPQQAVDTFLALLQDRLPGWLRTLHDLMHHAGRGRVGDNLLPVAKAGIAYYAEVQAAAMPAFVSPSLTVRFRQAMRDSELGPQAEIEPLAAYLAAEQGLGRIGQGVNPEATARLLLAGCFRHAYYETFTGVDSEPSRDESAGDIVRELRLEARGALES
ncbi:hypothetical protein Aple_088630 [Acrocarpospora pleiomorpha]|uniref:Transcriptional regulator TetR C-terminal Proteobacteria type domain-containing protein n=2 Tax=Acrocarpospora pleiomorpha TaxID=90975 RepID=A0A5M3XXS6_9ACTN|nr:hypothetical protein Aple_088630 [Acrocarpospora pleiomorpha]